MKTNKKIKCNCGKMGKNKVIKKEEIKIANKQIKRFQPH